MKIGIIQSVIGGGGGNDKVLFSILKMLKETNHQVTLYTVGEPRCDLKEYNIIKTTKVFPFKLPLFGIYQKLLEPMLAKKAKNEDVILALTGDLFLPDSKEQRLIFYSQNNYTDPTKMNTSKYKSGFWKWYYYPYKQMINKMMKDIDKYNIKFIANSIHVKEQLEKGLNVESDVIYPPVDLSEFSKIFVLDNMYDNENRKGITTITRYSIEKNLETVIEIMSNFPCAKSIFGSVNKINQSYFEKIRKLASDNNKIFTYKNENREHLKTLLQNSKVFLTASDETFGIAVIESIASGCIPIVPDTTANLETVPYQPLRYNPADIPSAISKVTKALNGDFDHYLPELRNHIDQFDEKVFQKRFLEELEHGL